MKGKILFVNSNQPEQLLTIGLPVKNAEQTIRQVINSLLRQSYSNFTLIISDNNSSDATADICAEYASKDERIQFHSQPIDIGAYANFRFVYDQAKTDFFMWVAADDIRSENHFEANIELLINNSNISVAGSNNTHTSGNEELVDFEIVGPTEKRLRRFLKNANKSYGVFYGMFRRENFSGYQFPEHPFLGWDWILNLHHLTKGDFVRSAASSLELGAHGESKSDKRWSQWRSSPSHWVVPFKYVNSAVMDLAKSLPVKDRSVVVLYLIRINFLAVLDQFQTEVRIFVSNVLKRD